MMVSDPFKDTNMAARKETLCKCKCQFAINKTCNIVKKNYLFVNKD